MSSRIALFGNIANNFFQLGRALRAHSDLDVHLLADAGADRIQRPESDDPRLEGNYPDWIHSGDYAISLRTALMPWRAPVVHDLREYDVAVVSGTGPVFAQFTRRPWCFLATGGDLTMTPFPWRFRKNYETWKSWLGMCLIAFWQRRAIRRADEIWAQDFAPNTLALRRLRVDPDRVSGTYFPFTLDTEVFCDGDVDVESDPVLRRMRSADLAVFHPSRLMLRATRELRESGQWKQNDVLIRAIAALVRRYPDKDVLLVMPDRSESPDLVLARRLIDELGLADHVLWATPPRPDGYTRHEMIQLYRASDVVVDEFGIGWFGMVVLEGLAVGRPVVSWVDERVLATMYPWHPILSAHEPAAVADLLEGLLDPEVRHEAGRRGRRWIVDFHASEATAPRYVDAVRGLSQRLAAEAS